VRQRVLAHLGHHASVDAALAAWPPSIALRRRPQSAWSRRPKFGDLPGRDDEPTDPMTKRSTPPSAADTPASLMSPKDDTAPSSRTSDVQWSWEGISIL
jgi:hypothetical protein